MLYGIDISNWQGRDGFSVKSLPSHVKFVICKVSEGTAFQDLYAQKFIHDAAETGRLWGFYHFAKGYDPTMEAEWFVANAPRNGFGHGMPILDYEVDLNFPGMTEAEWCEEFVTRVHELTGCWCVFYTYTSRLKVLGETWLPEKCPLWLADYPYPMHDFGNIYPNANTSPWSYAFMWQFTSQLRLPQYDGNLDGNIAYITEQDWKNYFGVEDEMKPEEVAQAVWGYDYNHTARGGSNVYDQAAATYDLAKRAAEAAEKALELVKKLKEGQ